ncbi:helix-turn-helix domain-containing protein [Rhodococcus koreensis]
MSDAEPRTVEEVLGAHLRRLREERELSLAEVGEALGKYLGKPWSPQGVWQAEKGKRDFKLAQLIAFALVFECPLSRLTTVAIPGVELSDTHTIGGHETAQLYASGVASGLLGSALVDMDKGLGAASRELESALERIEEQRKKIHEVAAIQPKNPQLPDLADVWKE